MKKLFYCVWVVAVLAGCSNGSCPLDSNLDPRCQSLCTDELPAIDGAFDVCSSDSLTIC
ncbi:MAG: hypothetical protein JRJ19_00410, partial [Deltaproteobacteria bacterium]|nr:hypothetical protein [Deltaproteobacteria bacterium]